MAAYSRLIFDWSEVWALVIPLGMLLYFRHQPPYLKPVVVYLWVALFLNTTIDVIGDYKTHFPSWMQSNNPLYNLHSIVRFVCFAAFFLALKQPHFTRIKKVLPLVSLAFIAANFIFVENFLYPNNLSGNLLTVEAYLLLIYCLLYYLSQLREDVDVLANGAAFWVTTGLCIYVVINFFVFLFYVPMIKQDWRLANSMWDVHNVAYILFCLSIAKAFYVSSRLEHRT